LERIERVNLDHLIEPLLVYEGKATETVTKFPQNVNVAATASLAGVGSEKTRVQVIADPTIDRNIHKIQARGTFGSLSIRLSNNPTPKNPKTSLLACLSVPSLLKSNKAMPENQRESTRALKPLQVENREVLQTVDLHLQPLWHTPSGCMG
jgi:predicted dinucleotide-utilizing enzyme